MRAPCYLRMDFVRVTGLQNDRQAEQKETNENFGG
jgi:hypothetical protein